MLPVDYSDYLEAGIKAIFPLHPIGPGGRCSCEMDDCKVPGKHPRMSSWQHVTGWTDAQLKFMTGEDEDAIEDQFLDGFGVNLRHAGKLVVDVDPRNGGWSSLDTLQQRLGLNLRETAGFVVSTGGGGLHIYYDMPTDGGSLALVTNAPDLPGIDFKSTGYVVGCGSLHASNNRYISERGTPTTITPAPAALLDFLKKPDRVRTQSGSAVHDVSSSELREIVMAIPNTGPDYERWLRVGMGVHHATQGTDEGYEIWRAWSAQCAAHDEDLMPMKWGSFGKSATLVTLGTLLEWAKGAGWQTPVTFEITEEEAKSLEYEYQPANPLDTMAGVDLLHPPGFVGQLAQWIKSRCLYPRDNLAVAAALMATANAAGMRHRVGRTGVTMNLMLFGIAASGSGKDAVLQRLQDCHTAAGIIQAQHGAIKSEQEITRNILRHQAALYAIDEVGALLAKLSNASKKGSASYLEGVVAAVMSIYSKAGGVLAVGGDIKEEMREKVNQLIAKVNSKLDRGAISDEDAKAELESLKKQLQAVDKGIEAPFLSLYGTSEPNAFNAVIGREMFVNGFFSRAIIIEEPDNVPRRRPDGEVSFAPMPFGLDVQLKSLYMGGESTPKDDARVEAQGENIPINLPLDSEAQTLSHQIADYWQQVSEDEDSDSYSLAPIPRRAWEQTLKIAGALGVAGGMVTGEHIRWAHAFVKRDIEYKLRVCKAKEASSSIDKDEIKGGILSAIRSKLHPEVSITIGKFSHAHRNYSKESLQAGLDHLVATGEARREEKKSSKGRSFVHYFAA